MMMTTTMMMLMFSIIMANARFIYKLQHIAETVLYICYGHRIVVINYGF